MGEEFGLVDVAIISWIMRDYILVEHRGYSRIGVSERFKAYADHLETRESAQRTRSVCNRFLIDSSCNY